MATTAVVLAGTLGSLAVVAAVAWAIRRDARRGAVGDPGRWVLVVVGTVSLGTAVALLFDGVALLLAFAIAIVGPLAYFLARVDPDHEPPDGADFRLPSRTDGAADDDGVDRDGG